MRERRREAEREKNLGPKAECVLGMACRKMQDFINCVENFGLYVV